MRTDKDQVELRDWLTKIGRGECGVPPKRNNLLEVDGKLLVNELKELIDFCFPAAFFDDPLGNAQCIANSAILCPKNKEVSEINNAVMERIGGVPKVYRSIDRPLAGTPTFGTFRSDFTLETIHNEMPPGVPPHILTLKVGAPIMLIRNLDVNNGLCNGTRLQIMKMTDYNLVCRIISGPRAQRQGANYDKILIPIIRFQYGLQKNEKGVPFERLQFPVRPCFAMTVNKVKIIYYRLRYLLFISLGARANLEEDGPCATR